MSLLLLMPNRDTAPILKYLRPLKPEINIQVWPEVANPTTVRMALCWNHQAAQLETFPNLQVVSSYGAGVDHFFQKQERKWQIVRIVDPHLIASLCNWCLAAMLSHEHHFLDYHKAQREKRWDPRITRPNKTVTLLGYGSLGSALAQRLVFLGYRVKAWCNSPKNSGDVEIFCQPNTLHEAISGSDTLINLLPLTPATENLLDRSILKRLNPSAHFINAARGGHLVEEDLLESLAKGWLSAATLDVTRVEPLPQEHPFWQHPKIRLTPHIAGITDPQTAAQQTHENYLRLLGNQPLLRTIDPVRGY